MELWERAKESPVETLIKCGVQNSNVVQRKDKYRYSLWSEFQERGKRKKRKCQTAKRFVYDSEKARCICKIIKPFLGFQFVAIFRCAALMYTLSSIIEKLQSSL